MQPILSTPDTVLLGIGNVLLRDDGVGIHVIEALRARAEHEPALERAALRDGGTIGLALLSEFEGCRNLIVIDATQMLAEAGTVRVFEGDAMDRQLEGTKTSAHEVALADLMTAAALAGCAPARRALIGIQPASTEWGLNPTQAVERAIPLAADAALKCLKEWTREL